MQDNRDQDRSIDPKRERERDREWDRKKEKDRQIEKEWKRVIVSITSKVSDNIWIYKYVEIKIVEEGMDLCVSEIKFRIVLEIGSTWNR